MIGRPVNWSTTLVGRRRSPRSWRVDNVIKTVGLDRLSPVTRYSAVGAVAKQLLQHLADGNYTPGTRLPPERQLAASLGVGRSTMREALAALDVLGLLDVRQGSGTYLAADS